MRISISKLRLKYVYIFRTDVYIYAVDPRSNSIVDMGELQRYVA